MSVTPDAELALNVADLTYLAERYTAYALKRLDSEAGPVHRGVHSQLTAGLVHVRAAAQLLGPGRRDPRADPGCSERGASTEIWGGSAAPGTRAR